MYTALYDINILINETQKMVTNMSLSNGTRNALAFKLVD